VSQLLQPPNPLSGICKRRRTQRLRVPIAIKSNCAAAISATLACSRRYFRSSDGNPASVVAFIRALVSVFTSSNVTTACFFSYRTSTLETPSTLFKAFLTVIGQAGHVMPGTFRVTVFDAAQAEAASKLRLKVGVLSSPSLLGSDTELMVPSTREQAE
jgi:hypothetical protein